MANARQRIALFIGVALMLATCKSQPTLREQLESIPVKQLSFYEFDPGAPIADRIQDPPTDLLSLYSNGSDVTFRPYHISDLERQQIVEVSSRLPVRHQQVLSERLIGIYCVENFEGSGMADYVLGPDDELYAVLILHPRVFAVSAAELLTYRANTSFRQEDSSIEISIELSSEVSGLAYILLHETTHIVDYVDRYTPFVEPSMFELFGRSERDTSFTDEAWTEYRTLAPDVDFAYQQNLAFYGLGGDPGLSNEDAFAVYAALSETPFPSMYAALSWAEDFAEYVAFQYLVNILGAHYTITVKKSGAVLLDYEPMKTDMVIRRAQLTDPKLIEPPVR